MEFDLVDQQQIQPGVRHFLPYQPTLEALRVNYRGQPVNEVKTAVQREWISVEGTALPDRELLALAEAVSQGRPIAFIEAG